MKAIAVIALAIPLLVATWGVVIEPLLIDERHETAALPGLPPCWRGTRIALIADLQVGMWLNNTGTIRRIVERLVASRPAAVLIAGDFVYRPFESDEDLEDIREDWEREDAVDAVREMVGLVRPLTDSGIPTFAVLGNHDYAMDVPGVYRSEWLAGRVRAALAQLGVHVLHNTIGRIPAPPDCVGSGAHSALSVVGIGPRLPSADRPLEALAQLSPAAPRIVLMHNPQSFDALPSGSAPLALAAHTHGGQIRLPFLPHWSWLALTQSDEPYADGWIAEVAGSGNRLYVNRGIGFSRLPLRLNCPPELTYFRLVPEPGPDGESALGAVS